jgi:uridine kinase
MDELAKQADQKIWEWAKEKPKLVVAIDGYTGVGKTTLINKLLELNPDIVHVCQDDFLVPTKPFIPGTHNQEEIGKIINAFKSGEQSFKTFIFNPETVKSDIPIEYDLSKNILIVDGVFMFHPDKLNHLWDRRVYLDGDIEEIDKRRVDREKARWGEKYFPETHPDSHFRKVTLALKEYQQEFKPEKIADLVLYNC